MKKYAWHFVAADRKLGYRDRRKVHTGRKYRYLNGGQKPPLLDEASVCHRGLHASERLRDAAWELRGPILCRVELSGDMDSSFGNSKTAAEYRKVLWMMDLRPFISDWARELGLTSLFFNGLNDVYKISEMADECPKKFEALVMREHERRVAKRRADAKKREEAKKKTEAEE